MSAAHSRLQLAQPGQRIGVVSSGMQQHRYQRCLAAARPLGRAGALKVAASKGFGKAGQQPKKREEVSRYSSQRRAEGKTGVTRRMAAAAAAAEGSCVPLAGPPFLSTRGHSHSFPTSRTPQQCRVSVRTA